MKSRIDYSENSGLFSLLIAECCSSEDIFDHFYVHDISNYRILILIPKCSSSENIDNVFPNDCAIILGDWIIDTDCHHFNDPIATTQKMSKIQLLERLTICDSEMPLNIRPITALTHIDHDIGVIDEIVSPARWYQYVTEKYINITDWGFADGPLFGIDKTDILYENELFQFLKLVGSPVDPAHCNSSSIEDLKISCYSLTREIAVIVSSCFPTLIHLVLFGAVECDLNATLQSQSLESLTFKSKHLAIHGFFSKCSALIEPRYYLLEDGKKVWVEYKGLQKRPTLPVVLPTNKTLAFIMEKIRLLS
ncbi:hypothetical protein K501DRAFT_272723 [Backusella circina FSU 941]|nr:hypothetical protein K501DRAFT_272723 [Backusella circina FSU 941]